MTFQDWIERSKARFQEEPPHKAAIGSANALLMGGKRRLGRVLGRPIWEREWDVLVILDACRLDTMQEVAPEYDRLPTDIDSVWSNASCSIDWINRNLVAYTDEMARTGYITGNPFANHDAAEARSAGLSATDCAYFAPLYQTHWGPVDGTAIETIPPRPLTDHAITAWRQRETLEMDQLIIHYMQPHQPYRSQPEWEQIGKNLKNLVDDREMAGACAWQRARRGEIGVDELLAACRDNLRWVLNDVTERLLPNLDGQVAISADHGNAAGEWGEWAHPPGALGPKVRKVPWVEVACEDTESVTPEIDANPGIDSRKPTTQTDTHEQLAALGYK